MDNTNIQTTTQTSSANNTIHAEQKPKLTFLDRYLYLREPHNRVNRSTFFFNLLFFGIILNILPENIIISMVLAVFILVQIIKRLHDFNVSGIWTIAIIFYHILAIFGPIMYFIVTGQAESYIDANLLWIKTSLSFGPTLPMIMRTIDILPTLMLVLIPGNTEENRFGKPWKV